MNSQPLIIAGSARSGTTWILDALAEVNQLRTVFEPLHPQAGKQASDYAHRYMPRGARASSLEKYFDKTFTGEFRSIWTDYRIRPALLQPTRERFSSPGNLYALYTEWRAAMQRYSLFRRRLNRQQIIVKMIRGNLMLEWFKETYDARIVYVPRHPGAVVESKLRIGGESWDPEPLIEHYRVPGVLGEYGERFMALLTEDLSPAESHTLIWCIENALPLEQAEKLGYILVYYEELRRNGEYEWRRIIDGLCLDNSPHGSLFIDRPSQQAAPERSKKLRGGGQNWYERLSSSELESIDRILRASDILTYSAYDPLPREKTEAIEK